VARGDAVMLAGVLRELRSHVGLRGREWFLAPGMLAVVVVWLYLGSARAFDALVGGEPWPWARWVYYHVNTLLLLGVLPLVVMRRVFGMEPAALGVRLGDVAFGVRFLACAIVVLTPLTWLSSLDPAFQHEYPLTKLAGENLRTWVVWELVYLVYYLGWEICFRGVLLFGLRDRFGTGGALAYQTAISTLVHIGKPFGETLGAVAGGVVFGAAALRSGSILWPLLAHWWLGATMDVFAFRHAAGWWP